MFNTKHYIKVGTVLRTMGWSHKYIAEYLGTSESWCRHNLAGIEEDKELMNEVANYIIQKSRLN